MNFLERTTALFLHYKELAEKAMEQLDNATLLHNTDGNSNSIVIIVKHLHGNMLSRWTNFLTEDGEKPWRQRDAEFHHEALTRTDLLHLWEEGWDRVFKTLESLAEADLSRTIHIRAEAMSVMDGILRQLTHYTYHVGQIVYIAKMKAAAFTSLSIPRDATAGYNEALFSKSHTPQ